MGRVKSSHQQSSINPAATPKSRQTSVIISLNHAPPRRSRAAAAAGGTRGAPRSPGPQKCLRQGKKWAGQVQRYLAHAATAGIGWGASSCCAPDGSHYALPKQASAPQGFPAHWTGDALAHSCTCRLQRTKHGTTHTRMQTDAHPQTRLRCSRCQ